MDKKTGTLEELQTLVSDMLAKAPDKLLAPVPQEALQGLYAYAHQFYQQGHYEQSENTFRMLTYLNALEPKYWKGLGAAKQLQKNYSGAIEAYSAARLLDTNNSDPEPSLQSANCYFALQQVKEGLRALNVAERSAKGKNDNKMVAHIALLKSMWSNETNKK